jgi:methionyl-tRNA formyltransferase
MSSAEQSARTLTLTYVTCSANGLYGLRHLHGQGWKMSGVVTISPETATVQTVSGYVDVRPWCSHAGIAVRTLPGYSISVADVATFESDVIVVNGWNRLIPADVIASAAKGALGVHAGHPPLGLGRAPLPWNIIKGHRDIEVYVFALTERADDGDIFASRVVEITGYDTVQTLYEKVMYQGAVLLDRALHRIAQGRRGRPQDLRDAVHYPKRRPEDGQVDFRGSVESIVDFIRAQSRPYPGAFSFLNGTRWIFWSAQPFDAFAFRDVERRPGQVVLALPSGVIVQTGTAALWITDAEAGARSSRDFTLAESETLVGQCFDPYRASAE